MSIKLKAHHAMMATGLLPLLYMYFFSTPKYIIGWGIGTYPLIVIGFIAGMQYQRTSNIIIQLVSMLYPVVFSLMILRQGDAHIYYAYALFFGLMVDFILMFARRVDFTYILVRTFLVTVFSVLLFSLSGVPLQGVL